VSIVALSNACSLEYPRASISAGAGRFPHLDSASRFFGEAVEGQRRHDARRRVLPGRKHVSEPSLPGLAPVVRHPPADPAHPPFFRAGSVSGVSCLNRALCGGVTCAPPGLHVAGQLVSISLVWEGDDARQYDHKPACRCRLPSRCSSRGHVVLLGILSQCRPQRVAPTMCLSQPGRYSFPETSSGGYGTRRVSDQNTGGDKTRKHAGAGQAQGENAISVSSCWRRASVQK
jgi:hypothetical protein